MRILGEYFQHSVKITQRPLLASSVHGNAVPLSAGGLLYLFAPAALKHGLKRVMKFNILYKRENGKVY